jgi:hypothetical protein
MPIFQLLMIAIFVRRSRSLEAGWKNVGGTRRLATLVWASGFLLTNGDLGGGVGESGIKAHDLISGGLDRAEKSDVAQLHAQLACWLNYWTTRYPRDTLEQAMLNLIVRLSKAKAGWIAERGDPFPFDRAIASACQGKFEQYVDGKV